MTSPIDSAFEAWRRSRLTLGVPIADSEKPFRRTAYRAGYLAATKAAAEACRAIENDVRWHGHAGPLACARAIEAMVEEEKP